MSSFNEVNGVPVTGSKKMLTNVLRKEFGFDGFVVSDWNSVTEMIAHGFAKDEKQAAELAVKAGLDMEMTSRAYEKFLVELIKEDLERIINLRPDFMQFHSIVAFPGTPLFDDFKDIIILVFLRVFFQFV